MAELLSICIPTFNRAAYLRELLNGLVTELEQTSKADDLVRLYISDNASTDATPEVVSSFLNRWPLIYNRNLVNIGGDHNFAQMIGQAPGTYFWLLGDDEWVISGFLEPLLNLLKPEIHHLVLLNEIPENGQLNMALNIQNPTTFPDYAAFVDHCRKTDPWKLMSHSLISLMIIKHAIFDQEMERQILKTKDRNYSHMYGLVEGLISNPGSVQLHQVPSVRIRNRRALVDTSVLEINYLWPRYFHWLGIKFGHSDLITYGRGLFSWQKRWRLMRRRIKRALGLGPDITRQVPTSLTELI